MEAHHIHPELLKHKVRVLVVGCGGNGSAIAAGLPYLHQALLAYGHPEGLHVTLLDADVISPTNCVPQPFGRSEVGLYKSVVLANRLNLFWGLDWQGTPEQLETKRRLDGVDILIGCVDTRAARATIAHCAEGSSELDYWLDLLPSFTVILSAPSHRWEAAASVLSRHSSFHHDLHWLRRAAASFFLLSQMVVPSLVNRTCDLKM